jgi:hypothetical protein
MLGCRQIRDILPHDHIPKLFNFFFEVIPDNYAGFLRERLDFGRGG